MPSIDKIHRILETLQRNNRLGMTNKEISRELNIPPSTCYRILAALKKVDYITQRKPDLRYFLGYAHLRFAESVLEGMDEAAICLPYLEELHQQTEETTFFALFGGQACIAMEVCGHINTRVSVGRGEIMPLHASASGLVVLAYLPKREQLKLIQEIKFESFTGQTMTDEEQLYKRLDKIHRNGFSVIVEEFHNGINALAVPVFKRDRVLGSIAVVGTSVDLDPDQLLEYSDLFLRAGIDISNTLGGQFPPGIARRVDN